MGRFTLPRDLYHGTGSLETLKTLTGKKAIVVVGGGSMKRFGFLDKAVAYLKEAGMEVELFEGVEPDPSVETVMKGAEAMRKFQPDWIVAMGGGSPIDAAKAMWVCHWKICSFRGASGTRLDSHDTQRFAGSRKSSTGDPEVCKAEANCWICLCNTLLHTGKQYTGSHCRSKT